MRKSLSILFTSLWMLLGLAACQGASLTPVDPPSDTPTLLQTTSTVAAPIASPSSTPFPGPWQLVSIINVHHSVMTAGFLDEQYGVTGGAYPSYMHFTEDGGQTWTMGTNNSDCRYGMEIVDRQVSYVCGGFQQIVATTDGGRTWRFTAEFGSRRDRPCRAMSFISRQEGWLTNQHRIGSTANGGESWTELNLPEEVEIVAGIGLYAPQQGYMMDTRGIFYHTLDNGAHWEQVQGPDLGGGQIVADTYAVVVMRFQDADHGIIVLRLKTGDEEHIMAYHTADAGQSWSSEVVPVEPGSLYISRDGRLLTVLHGGINIMTVLRYTGE